MTVDTHLHKEDRGLKPAAQRSSSPWKIWALLVCVIGGIYLLMYNPYWVPGGDSELYVAVARSWATGHRDTFNGQFVSISPPGWPLLLAAAMKISPTFGFLKLITITSLTLAMGLWFWFLQRFMPIRRAALLTMMTAIIGHVYPLSFWMHSDAFFCLIATASMVVACQINERRSHLGWRIALLALLCIISQFIRWAAALEWLIIAGILLRGHELPITIRSIKRLAKQFDFVPRRWNPQWVTIVLTWVITTATLLTLRHALQLTPQQELESRDAGANVSEAEQQPPEQVEARTVDILNGKQNAKETLLGEMIKRVRDSGKWFSWLLWPELRFAGGVKVMSSVDTFFGWLLIVPLGISCWQGVRRRDWIWAAVAISSAFLCLNWPNPNARYLVPMLPLVLWGILDGIPPICRAISRPNWARGLAIALIASVIVANAALLSVDIWVARSRDFYARYEDGLNQSLIADVHFLDDREIHDDELGVSDLYFNLGRRRDSKSGLRAVVMLSNVIVRSVPGKLISPNVEDDITKLKWINWMRSRHLRWYLYQQPISPWRVWHFRIPAWLQKALSREPVGPESAGWVLYHRIVTTVNVPLPVPHQEILMERWVHVEVPPIHDWPTRVPGM